MFSAELARWLPVNPRIVVALSGGPDSVFLATELVRILPATDLAIAHFDHRLRASSSQDAAFCQQWAKEHKLRSFQSEWQSPEPSEEKARTARSAFLQDVATQFDADAIALGTHADDEAETIFFNFLRGTGVSGLAGIKPFDAQTRFFRPLLSLRKQEILDTLHERKLPYCTDETNGEDDFDRNFLRNTIFPRLEERFPAFSDRIGRQAQLFRMTETFLIAEADKFLKEQHPTDATEIRVRRADFAALAPIIQLEVVRRLFTPLVPDLALTQEWQQFVVTAASGKKKQLGKWRGSVFSEYFFLQWT